MKKFRKIIAVLTIAMLMVPSMAWAAKIDSSLESYTWDGETYDCTAQDVNTISIAYTGDVMGNFVASKGGSLASAYTQLKALRKEMPNTYFVDNGNFLSSGNKYGVEEDGSFDYAFMGMMTYDAVALGNMELDKGLDQVRNAVAYAFNNKGENGQTPFIISNGTVGSNLVSSFTVEQKYGNSVAFFNVIDDSLSADADLTDPVEAAQNTVAAIKATHPNVDMIVAMVKSNDEGPRFLEKEIAESVEGINLIITNSKTAGRNNGEQVCSVPLVGAEENSMGQVIFTKDTATNTWNYSKDVSYKLSDSEENSGLLDAVEAHNASLLNSYFEGYGLPTSYPLTNLPYELNCDGKLNNGFGQLVALTYRYGYAKSVDSKIDDVPLAFVTEKALKNSLPQGDISPYDCFEVFGSAKNDLGTKLLKLYLTGKEVKRLAERDASYGEDSRIYFSGLNYSFCDARMTLNKLESVEENYEDDQLYLCITDEVSAKAIADYDGGLFGLNKVFFKDKDGISLDDFSKESFDFYNGNTVKAWSALATYINNNGVKSKYFDKDEIAKAKVENDGTFFANFSNPSTAFKIILFGIIAIIAIVLLLLILLKTVFNKTYGRTNKSKYRKIAKANKQAPIFSKRKNKYKDKTAKQFKSINKKSRKKKFKF
ncbi:MAG: hypothetical protein MJ145_01810 [Clostridia bacterium]|nr:hypothetical protein [Clostridia bacterium]